MDTVVLLVYANNGYKLKRIADLARSSLLTAINNDLWNNLCCDGRPLSPLYYSIWAYQLSWFAQPQQRATVEPCKDSIDPGQGFLGSDNL